MRAGVTSMRSRDRRARRAQPVVDTVWHREGDAVAMEMLRALAHSGTHPGPPVRGPEMVGATVSFGASPGPAHLHSHITGIVPGSQLRGSSGPQAPSARLALANAIESRDLDLRSAGRPQRPFQPDQARSRGRRVPRQLLRARSTTVPTRGCHGSTPGGLEPRQPRVREGALRADAGPAGRVPAPGGAPVVLTWGRR